MSSARLLSKINFNGDFALSYAPLHLDTTYLSLLPASYRFFSSCHSTHLALPPESARLSSFLDPLYTYMCVCVYASITMEEYIYIYIARCSLKVAKSGVKGHGKWYVRTVRSVGRRKGQVDKKIARRKGGGDPVHVRANRILRGKITQGCFSSHCTRRPPLIIQVVGGR